MTAKKAFHRAPPKKRPRAAEEDIARGAVSSASLVAGRYLAAPGVLADQTTQTLLLDSSGKLLVNATGGGGGTSNVAIVSPLGNQAKAASVAVALGTDQLPLPVQIQGSSGAVSINLAQVGAAAIALGQTTMSASVPVTLASNQSALATTAAQLPSTLVGGRLDENLGAFGGSAVTIGQHLMAASMPVALASDQSTLNVAVVSGGFSPNINLAQVGGTSIALGQTTMSGSLPVTLASNQSILTSKISDGTNTAAVKPASTAPVATDAALVVSISPNSIGATGLGTNIASYGGAATTLGQKTKTLSIPVTLPSDIGTLQVQTVSASTTAVSNLPSSLGSQNAANSVSVVSPINQPLFAQTPEVASYVAAFQMVSPAGPSFWWTMSGVGLKTVRIRRIRVYVNGSGASQSALQLVLQRGTALTGGSASATITPTPLNTTNAAGTPSILAYAVTPPTGLTGPANVWEQDTLYPITGTFNPGPNAFLAFEAEFMPPTQALCLLTGEFIAFKNLSSVLSAGSSITVNILYSVE